MMTQKGANGQEAPKYVGDMKDWARVAAELQGEDLKQKIYDNALFGLLGDIRGKRMLDYGAGPAIIAGRAAGLGADVKAFDISEDMLRIAAMKLRPENVYYGAFQIPANAFDIVLCNLVLCIVPEPEVVAITRNIRQALKPSGVAYIGFCNPQIFDVPESVIDFRQQAGKPYDENHTYKKVKKEGGYEILELHRPIEWYLDVFRDAGLHLEVLHFTPEYDVSGRKVSDFCIFELRRGD